MANVRVVTPVGSLYWVKITGNGYDASIIAGEKQGDEEKWKKSACLRLKKDSPECKKLIADINSAWEAFKAEKGIKKPPKSLGYKPALDSEGNETDEYEFKFSTNSFYKDGKPNKVIVLNAKGKEVEIGDRLIGNESKGCIHGTIGGYSTAGNVGVSLYLTAIQLTKFIEYTKAIEAEDLSEYSEGDDEPAFDNFDNQSNENIDI